MKEVTKEMPRVTVVMALYNGAQFLGEAVASILAQTYRDFELIVVDDASSDDSLLILQSFDDQRIRVISHQTNKGAALSRNDALASARGEFVAIMDADDVCVPTRLERQVAFLDANPAVGLVGCGIYDNIDAEGEVLHTSYLPEHNEAIQRELVEQWCFLHSSIMFRRRLYETVGGYVSAFEPAEDHDFALRVVEHCESHNLYERLVSYRLNPKGLSVVGRQSIEQARTAAILMAHRRRSGQLEGRKGERCRVPTPTPVSWPQKGVMQTVRASFCVANRYYGFGCLELNAGHLKTARRCFIHSVRANCLFVRSWIGIGVSLLPFVADKLKSVFPSSMDKRRRLRLVVPSASSTHTAIQRTLVS